MLAWFSHTRQIRGGFEIYLKEVERVNWYSVPSQGSSGRGSGGAYSSGAQEEEVKFVGVQRRAGVGKEWSGVCLSPPLQSTHQNGPG